MLQLNKVLLCGRLARDPELKTTTAGTAVCNVTLVLNRKGIRKDGTELEEVCFIDVAIWGARGEAFARFHKRGDAVFVEGRLVLDQWESAGEKRSKIKVCATDWQFAKKETD